MTRADRFIDDEIRGIVGREIVEIDALTEHLPLEVAFNRPGASLPHHR